MNHRNAAGLALLGICLMFLCAFFMSTGCVTMAKTMYYGYTVTPEPTTIATPTPTITETPIPTKTPTPKPTESYQSFKSRRNQYNLSEWYTFTRDNVSAQQDLTVRTTVYRIRFMDKFNQHSTSWGTDSWWQYLPESGNKYLFVWICQYRDDSDRANDPWGLDEFHIRVQIDQKLYKPITDTTLASEPIKELITTYTLANDIISPPYGYSGFGDPKDTRLYYLYPGRSNAWDGYVIFEVPEETADKDIKVIFNFNNLAPQAYWTATAGGDYY